MRQGARALLGLVLLLSACTSRTDTPAEETVLIPFDTSGNVQLVGRVCRPTRPGPNPVVVINHGLPSRPEDRPFMRPASCDSEPARWFNARGYIVVFALRRGFGDSTGPDVEDITSCTAPYYLGSGLASARDVDAIVAFATSLPDARPAGAIVVGQSAGGWATVAYNSQPHPRVAGVISMAGGRGAVAFGVPGQNCRPDLIVAAARRFGETGHSPMLWIYASTDSFFPPALALEMWRAYISTGNRTALFQPENFPGEGHLLFYAEGGSRIWGPAVDAYLARLPGH